MQRKEKEYIVSIFVYYKYLCNISLESMLGNTQYTVKALNFVWDLFCEYYFANMQMNCFREIPTN